LYKRLGSASLRIDPEARSSMWEDLQASRRTEIDYLNGAVVTLAQSVGLDAPANRRIVDLVHAAEKGESQAMAGKGLLMALQK
jgi:2-dehydropantoate 2-reductase